jgi:iron complex outermembrane recepter protein
VSAAVRLPVALILCLLVIPAGDSAAQTGTITGLVMEAATGVPLAGANVILVGTERGAATDAEGAFRISGLPQGAYTIRASYVGYRPEEVTVDLPAGGTVRFDFGLIEEMVDAAVEISADRLRTVARTAAPPLLVPQSLVVIDVDRLAQQGRRDVAAVLREVSGVTLAGREQPFGTFTLRGFPADETGTFRRNGVEIPHLADGLRANVTSVEVLKGPASVLYGRLEPGGVVNFVTRQPGCGPGARNIELEGAAYGTGAVRGTLAPECRPGGTALVLDAAAERRGSIRREVDQHGGFASGAARRLLGPSTVVTVDAELDFTTATLDPGLALAGMTVPATFDRGPFFGEPDARYRWRSGFGSATVEHRLAGRAFEGVTARVAFGSYVHGRDIVSLDSIMASGMIARSYNADETRYRYLYGELSTEGRFTTGPLDHAFVAGLEATRLAIDVTGEAPLQPIPGGFRFASIDPVSATEPEPSGLPAGGQLVRYVEASGSGLNLGLFAQQRVRSETPAGPLHAVLSARLAHVTAGASWFALAATADTPAGLNERSAEITSLTPAAAVLLEAAPWMALYATYGTSFNPIFQQVDADGQPFEPTRGEQFEAGLKMETPHLEASLAVFEVTKRGALSRTPGGFYVQTGGQRSRGLEVDLAASPRDGITLHGAYTLLDAVVTADELITEGNRLAAAPRHSGRAWGSARIVGDASRGVTVRAGLQYVGERFATLQNDLPLPAHFLVDGAVSYRAGRGIELVLAGENLLDERFVISGERRGMDPRPLVVGWPGDPLTVTLRLLVRL